MEHDVIAVQQLFWDALKNKDRQLFERALAENFVSVSLSQPQQSRAEFITTLTSFPAQIISVTSQDIAVHIFDNVAILTGVQIAQIQLPNGAQITDKIALTNIFQHIDGQWRMVLARPIELA